MKRYAVLCCVVTVVCGLSALGGEPVVVGPGLGTVPRDCIAGEMRDPKNGGYLPKDTILLDLVAIKPTKRQVHVFRCGLGGLASDLEYTYG